MKENGLKNKSRKNSFNGDESDSDSDENMSTSKERRGSWSVEACGDSSQNSIKLIRDRDE